MRSRGNVFSGALVLLFVALCFSVHSPQADQNEDQIEFFEKRIRPVLAQECYECHRIGDNEKSGLALDHREGLRRGGRSGKAIVPGDPEASLLIQAIRHASDDLKMPKSGPKLPPSIIADFEEWIRMGAPDPRDAPPQHDEIAAETNWAAVMERRKDWWSFQPIQKTHFKETPGHKAHPVDFLVQKKLAEAGIPQAPRADKRTLLRRLSFALSGLPPTPGAIRKFENDTREGAFERQVDSLLASPRFGERWARHWMDWMRYADSHGSEGDPAIPYAWRYRDYLIRALNQDVPYDQLVREHLAGDLLDQSRLNPELGINESALGIGHLRMVLHGFAPTDPLDERVRNIDDQIDVITKTFLGLTVSCARCHHHKFDAITQHDFYALYGIFASSTPASIGVDIRTKAEQKKRDELAALKSRIKGIIAKEWIDGSEEFIAKLANPDEPLKASIATAERPESFLHLLYLVEKQGGNVSAAISQWKNHLKTTSRTTSPPSKRWNLNTKSDTTDWRLDGDAEFTPPGACDLALEGDRILASIHPGGVYSHLTSSKDRAIIVSPLLTLDQDYDLWMRVRGTGGAVARYVVQNYPRDGTIYPVTRLDGDEWRWVKHSLNYWKGERIHVELSTAADQAILANTSATRSSFGITKVLFTPGGSPPPPEPLEFWEPLAVALNVQKPVTLQELAQCFATAMVESARPWAHDRSSDPQALLLNQFLQLGLLENSLSSNPGLQPLVARYRELESSLPVPRRAPGIIETAAEDKPLLIRGDHKLPGDPVPRKFLDAFTSTPYKTNQTARLQLAEDFLAPWNPFTTRVIVNRVWHHLFGMGLVATPDNFGRLGEPPSHPELLDFLAGWFAENDYSIKKLIRFLVTSETWQASSTPPPRAEEIDPGNKLLSHAPIRRLEAEAIRDAILFVSGDLSEEMYGPPVTGITSRRSVYVRVQRNDLDPFLSTFDAPVPSSTKGRRDVTNVPGQSLTLLNDPFILQLAEHWIEHLNTAGAPDTDTRLATMFETALGRPPTSMELEETRKFLRESSRHMDALKSQKDDLEKQHQLSTEQLEKLTTTAKERIQSRRAKDPNLSSTHLPTPVASWDFRQDLRDQVGNLHGKALGNARIESGALVFDGRGSYVATAPLPYSLEAKTLEVWVQLDNLQQQGGGVFTIQDLQGEVFDAIVFGEQRAGHWVAGSDFFRRTSDFQGPSESEAKDTPVHLVTVYEDDGTITAYRNGVQYGKPYKSKGPIRFEAEKSQVLFGNRHGSPGGNKNLIGKIFGARLYGKALTPGEVATSHDLSPIFSEQTLVEALTDSEQRTFATLQAERVQLAEDLATLEKSKGLSSEWAHLAHSLFNLKEFIYIP